MDVYFTSFDNKVVTIPDAKVVESTSTTITLSFQVDVCRTFVFDKATGKQVDDDYYWIDPVTSD
jgi:hypothetical protein